MTTNERNRTSSEAGTASRRPGRPSKLDLWLRELPDSHRKAVEEEAALSGFKSLEDHQALYAILCIEKGWRDHATAARKVFDKGAKRG